MCVRTYSHTPFYLFRAKKIQKSVPRQKIKKTLWFFGAELINKSTLGKRWYHIPSHKKTSACTQRLSLVRTRKRRYPERGVAGLDPSTRGRSPVVLEVRFRSRALFKAEIQSEIVPGYLYYLGFCTVWRRVVHSHFACRNTIYWCSSLWVFSTFVASVTMPKKLRSKCLRGWQRHLKQVNAGLPNAYQEGPSDRAYFSRTGASPPASAAGCTVCLAKASAAAGTGACMTCMVRTVLTIHVRQVHLPMLPLSATKAFLAKLLLHSHPSGATQNISNVPEIQENTKKVARTESGTVAMKI